jgi:hypothetical protein
MPKRHWLSILMESQGNKAYFLPLNIDPNSSKTGENI